MVPKREEPLYTENCLVIYKSYTNFALSIIETTPNDLMTQKRVVETKKYINMTHYEDFVNDDNLFEEDFVDDYNLFEEERTYECYNGSYAQEVEGWSDQDIDDVFDGDPDAYWNID